MSPNRPVIVVADDSPTNLQALLGMLAAEDYEVLAAEDGQAVLDLTREETPDLVLLDVLMPGLNGYEVCEHLKREPRLAHVPVIFITAKSGTEDVVRGFDAGAADYVAKPFNQAEVLARVGTHLQLSRTMRELERLREVALDANPLTGLPGNKQVAAAIREAVELHEQRAVVLADLDGFKAYNDKYGFARGDAALKHTADLIVRIVREECGEGQFVGHLGGDDFIFLVPSGRVRATCMSLARAFDQKVASLYDPEDVAAGRIRAVDREGRVRSYPLMTLSMGGVDLAGRAFTHYLHVADRCNEVKMVAKRMPGSSIYFDQRRAP